MTVFATPDLTAASYSAALFGLIATSVLLLMGTAWTRGHWKLVITLCACSTIVGAIASFEARAAWSSGAVPIVYHYVGWVISMPIQVLALFFFARTVGEVSVGLFWRLLVVSVLMIFFRYLGEAGYMNATLAFLIGLIFWLYILGELFFGRMDAVITASLQKPVIRSYFWLRLIVTVGWAIYPLGNFITSFGGYDDGGALSVAYNLADFLNRMAFGAAMLSAAMLAAPSERSAAEQG
ncbi:bacteriorhodopsin [Roseovarius sp. D0-M9]|uniref:bacteriorhodopsin n=1 Tax=Roseovarius sp. D0-M9 TaxID=3127117 RepID=UPI0030104828